MHLRVCLLNRYAVSQTCGHAVIKDANILLPVLVTPRNGYKHLCRMVIKSRSAYGKRKRWRHDADHSVRSPLEENRASECPLRSTKRTLSESVVENCHSLRVIIFFLCKHPTK